MNRLLTYPQIEDLTHPSDRDKADKEEFQHFQREIYQKVFKILFASICQRSWQGEAMRCGDAEIRILYPGVCILSLDLEEAWYFCACRSAAARHPCPKCLVHRNDLHNLSLKWPLRTSELMQRVVLNARQQGKTKREEILQDYGLHDVDVCYPQLHNFSDPYLQHFLWKFRFSDP